MKTKAEEPPERRSMENKNLKDPKNGATENTAEARIRELTEEVRRLESENKKMSSLGKAQALLAEKKLPGEFAAFLATEDWEETQKRIGDFEKAFFKAVETAITEKLRGRAPMAGETTLDPFVLGFMR
ncbi:MAG: DUF4355 domain-containing protein [Christensenellaceae bacterium]|nr:DUF4355 domain-containing protein [Christensenellaceae bacterium]